MKYIIGDIHGEISKLKTLINFIFSTEINPSFVFIGDYIDKGEDALKTLDFLTQLSSSHECIFLMGNHEYCWLHAHEYEEYLVKYGGLNTVKSFGCSTIKSTRDLLIERYKSFFDGLKTHYFYKDYVMTHSGIAPEFFNVESLDTLKTTDFLFNRYDFITKDEFYKKKYKIVFGHTGFFMPFVNEYKIGIDTGACYLEEQPITAFNLDTKMFFDSNLKNYSLASINGNFCPNIMRNKPWRIYD
jgi:serine/threonine protein phosphatase 1